MKTYNVKEVAKMLNTNPETVRRWIREGKLIADKSSRKSGNMITESALKGFLQAYPKYKLRAEVTLTSAVVVGGLVAQNIIEAEQAKHANVPNYAIIRFAQDKIQEYTNAIKSKENTIHELEKQIEADKAQISEYQKLIDSLRISK